MNMSNNHKSTFHVNLNLNARSLEPSATLAIYEKCLPLIRDDTGVAMLPVPNNGEKYKNIGKGREI